ncbi:uncharacterized protein LOC134693257 isoform X2 [Mytilus trossulus]
MFPEYLQEDTMYDDLMSTDQTDTDEADDRQKVYTPQAMHPGTQPMPGNYQQSQYYQYAYDFNRPAFYPQCHPSNNYQRAQMIHNEPYDLNRQSPDLPVPARYMYEMNVDVIARKQHVPMAAWAKPTPLNMANLIDSSKFEHVSPAARDKILAERSLFQYFVRKVVEETGLRTVKGEAFNTCLQKLQEYIPNLSRERDVIRRVRESVRKNINYRRKKEAMYGEKIKPAPSRKPTDYLNFDDHLSPDALEFGKIVCVTFQGFPVGKAKIAAYPSIEYGMSDDDRKDFATIQLELKKKNSKVDYLPWHKEKRSWEQLGKGCRTGWRVEDLVPVERYDEFIKESAKNKRDLERARKRQRKDTPEVDPEPVVPEPVVAEPPVVEPEVPEPPVVEAEVPEPPVVEQEPPVVEAEVPEPPVVEAEVPEPPVVEAEVPEPPVVEPEVPEPPVVEPEVPEPPVVEPEVPEPEPEVPEPPVVEPEVPEPEPEVPEPPVVEPEVPEPEVVEPEPAVVEPEIEADQDVSKTIRYELHDYVEVILHSEKKNGTSKKFYAMVIDIQPLEVKFLKDTSLKCVKIWPRIQDTSVIDHCNVIRLLSTPHLDQRERLHFSD